MNIQKVFIAAIISLFERTFATSSSCNSTNWSGNGMIYNCSNIPLNNNDTISGEVVSIRVNQSLLKMNSLILKPSFDQTKLDGQEVFVDILVYSGSSWSSVWSYGSEDMKREISIRIDVPIRQGLTNEADYEELKIALS